MIFILKRINQKFLPCLLFLFCSVTLVSCRIITSSPNDSTEKHDLSTFKKLKQKEIPPLETELALLDTQFPEGYLLIDKTSHSGIYRFNRETIRFPISYGAVEGDKIQEGDDKTPHGAFHICEYHESSIGNGLFFTLNYPLPEDAERGLAEGIIDQFQYTAIMSAHNENRCPPATPLGSAIGLHGREHLLVNGKKINGKEFDQIFTRLLNFSDGCIVTQNQVIKKLARVLKGKPAIIIR